MNKIWPYAAVFIIILIFVIAFVLPGRIILPQYVSAGPIAVHYYGVCMALAIGAGMYLAQRRASDFGIDREKIESIMLWLVIGGFIGARLYHVFSSFGYYYSHPSDILKIWNGGLSIYGAVIGGVTALIIWVVTDKDSLWHGPKGIFVMLNWLAPSVALGQTLGRFGNMFNYELYGYPTNMPWKMFVPKQFRLSGYESQAYFHPLFLYEAVWNVLVLIFLLWLESKRRKDITPGPPPQNGVWGMLILSEGKLFLWYVLLYNAGRFFLEFLRIDSVFIGTFRLNAMVSLLFVGLSLLGLAKFSRRNSQESHA